MVCQSSPFGLRLAGLLLVQVHDVEGEFFRGAVCIATFYVSLLLIEYGESRTPKPGESSRKRGLIVTGQGPLYGIGLKGLLLV